ncbi:MAG: hypothetical protein K2P01_06390 [Oscillospiraceae bacterium]|nr:hypothetical protein [Oscillospiraceae bacterium]
MADLSPAEIMLKNSTNRQYLIRQLQALKTAPIPRVGIDIPRRTKDKIAAFQRDLQGYIDELTAQREKAVALVKLIPDQTAQEILLMRYGLTGSGREMTWIQVEMQIPYCMQSLYRYHKKGIAQLNQILEGETA